MGLYDDSLEDERLGPMRDQRLRMERHATFERRGFLAGAAAFAHGIKSSPCLDPICMHLLREASPEMSPDGRSYTIAVLDAWSRGWHTANRAAPIEEKIR